MRLKKVTVTGTGTSNWLPVDTKQAPFNLSVGCIVVSGTATYSVEYTYDNVFDSTVTPVAFALSTITAATTSKDGAFTSPVVAIRLNVTGGTSPVVSMSMIQGLR